MKKFFLVILVTFLFFSVFGRIGSPKGLQVNHAIAMEQGMDELNMLKPPKDPDPPAEFPQAAPNDYYYQTKQWNLDDYGETYKYGKAKNAFVVSNHGIQAEKAWQLGYSGAGVKIAIIGFGIAFKNIDADGDGVIDITKAPDFANTSFDETNAIDFTHYSGDIQADLAAGTVDMDKFSKNPIDLTGVATMNAGIMAATTNNEIGIAGIAYGATILPIKIWSYDGDAPFTGIENGWVALKYAFNHAVASGADIIYMTNMSSPYDAEMLHTAIQSAVAAGVVVICSGWANGEGLHCPADYIYPSAYEEVIAVGAANFNGVPNPTQSMSGDWLDLIAPAGDNQDLNRDGYYDKIWGFWCYQDLTQFMYGQTDYHGVAGAQVAAIAALMLDKNPSLTPANVKSILIATAKHDDGVSYPNATYGNGLVDAYGALMATPNP